VLWLDAAVGITPNGTDVAAWADQSGNGNDAAQTTASKQPFIDATGFQGLDTVVFDGVSENLQIPDDNSLDLTGSFTWFYVGNFTAPAANRSFFNKGAITGYLQRIDGGTRLQMVINDGINNNVMNSSGIPVSTDVIFTGRLNLGVNCNYTQLGISIGNPTNNLTLIQTNATDLFIGSNSTGTGEFLPGDMSHLLIYNSALSTSNMNLVGNFLANIYGLTWTDIP